MEKTKDIGIGIGANFNSVDSWNEWVQSGRAAASRGAALVLRQVEAEQELRQYCIRLAPKDARGVRRQPLLAVRGPIVEALRTCLTRAERSIGQVISARGAERNRAERCQGAARSIGQAAVQRLDQALELAKEAHWWALWACRAMSISGVDADPAETNEFIAGIEGGLLAAETVCKSAVSEAKREVLIALARERREQERKTKIIMARRKREASLTAARKQQQDKARGPLTLSLGQLLKYKSGN